MKHVAVSAMATVSLFAIAAPVLSRAPAPVASAAVKPQFGSFGLDQSAMDRSVAPGDDFYAYTNGHWNTTTEIPADRASWGSFNVLRNLSDQRTRDVIQAAPATSRVGMLYASFMDEAAVEAAGVTPLKAPLADIAALNSPADLAHYFAKSARLNIGTPIDIGIGQDLKDNTQYVPQILQGGLGMPDRDYYLKDEPSFVATRAKYITYIETMMRLAGQPDPTGAAQRIFTFEKSLAELQQSRAERRQVEKRYNPVNIADIATTYPGFDWTSFLQAAGVATQPRAIVANVEGMKKTVALVGATPMPVMREYLAYHVITDAAPLLSKPFVEANFAFYGTTLSGTPQLKERWKRGVDLVNAALGEEVGQMYVARYFPPEAKAKADAMVHNIIAAMDARLSRVTWMAPATKVVARAKLAAFTPKIGYPTKWRDYSALEISSTDLVGNAARAAAFEYQRQLNKIGKPLDRTEWGMTPQTVNAYANTQRNEIVFPAAILQPPFFDPNADPAVNYGGIGAVIGHEISHHFDDQGRKFDKSGNLADWWTPGDIDRFKGLTDKVVAQYGAYEPLAGTHINGQLTLGENMADLAGINVAHDAYVLSLGGKRAPVLGGTTGDQRFFLGFAQIWRFKARDAALKQQLTTDPHSPASFRPYVVRNLDAWYSAFNVRPGQKYYLAPADRVRVW